MIMTKTSISYQMMMTQKMRKKKKKNKMKTKIMIMIKITIMTMIKLTQKLIFIQNSKSLVTFLLQDTIKITLKRKMMHITNPMILNKIEWEL
jgi:hypothetical protein